MLWIIAFFKKYKSGCIICGNLNNLRMFKGNNIYKKEILYEKVWDKPLEKVGEEYGVSATTIRKICNKMNIPLPDIKYRLLKENK